MRNASLLAMMCNAAVVMVLAASAMGQYRGGSGDPNDPWQIGDPNDLIAMGQNTQHYADAFILTADIDMAGTGPQPDGSFTTAVIAPDADPGVAGFQGDVFRGTLDGDGYVIRDLVINGSGAGHDYLGLFGTIDNGEVRALGLEGGSVTGNDYVGGLVGHNGGSVTFCYVNGVVNSAGQYVGGLVGWHNGSIMSCYATGTFNAAYDAGALVGYNNGAIASCYATGSVSGSGVLGGLVGANGGTIVSCYATGAVTGYTFVGGLAGRNDGTVTSCYATGVVTSVSSDYPYWKVGGLVGGDGDGEVCLSFWDVWTTGISISHGGFGRTTSQMHTATTYWGWGNGEWTLDEGADYPHLAWEDAGGAVINVPARTYTGGGVVGDPFVIATADDLVCMTGRMADWGKHFELAGDINMTAVDFYPPPIGFSGILEGGGHVISNLTIAEPSSSHVGVLGSLTSGGVVRNLGLEGGAVTGNDFVGGVVGTNGGSVTSCHVAGVINGTGQYVGGVVGANDGSVASCHATSAVDGGGWVGGLVGRDNGSITSCSATGAVTCASHYVGGLVGRSYEGTITSCYATGAVNGAESSVGGLVGYVTDGTLTSCYATGLVSGDDDVGGLVGLNGGGALTSCYATGLVAGDDNVGGLVGLNGGGALMSCYATGAVTGSRYVGGLVGRVTNGTISSCYATGLITGSSYAFGGLVGYSYNSAISSCYFLETAGQAGYGIPLSDAEMRLKTSFGGFDFANDPNDGEADMWLIDEGVTYPYPTWQTLSADDCDGNGIPDEFDLDCNGNGIPDGCDIIDGTSNDLNGNGIPDECELEGNDCNGNGIPDDWEISQGVAQNCNGNDLPDECEIADLTSCDIDGNGVPDECEAVAWLSGGSGSRDDPYLIATAQDLIDFGSQPCALMRFALLISDIDLTGYTFDAPLMDSFSGFFDGGGHVIRNVTLVAALDSTAPLALFGELDNEGQVVNLGIEGLTVSGQINTGQPTAGLVVNNQGTIIGCYVTGSMTLGSDRSDIGGLVAGNQGRIDRCYAAVSILGGNRTRQLGVLVGFNDGEIIRSYATGSITAGNSSQGLGSLVGYSSNTVTHCYATGAVVAGPASSDIGGLVGSNYGQALQGCFSEVDSPLEVGLTCQCGPCEVTCLTSRLALDVYEFAQAGWDFATVWTYEHAVSSWPVLRPLHADTYEPDDDATHATAIATDGTAQHHWIGGSDKDWLTFTLSQTESVLVAPLEIDTHAQLQLLDANLSIMQTGVPISDTPEAGLYYVMLRSFQPIVNSCDLVVLAGDTDAYEPDDADPLATVITADGVGQIHRCLAGDQDWLTFTVETPGRVVVQTTHLNGQGDLATEMFQASDLVTVIGPLDSHVADATSWDAYLLSAGQYYLRFDADAGTPSDGYRVAVWDVPPFKYSGGVGTEDDPYQLANANDLLELSLRTEDYEAFFVLTDDIDLSGHTFTSAVIAADGEMFTGWFDGRGHVIRNLTIDDGGAGYLGLFGWLGDGAHVINVGIDSISIRGDAGGSIGALAAQNGGVILGCYANGSITVGDDATHIGGLVGSHDGSSNEAIIRCHADVVILAGSNAYQVGGLVGYSNAPIAQCYATGRITVGNNACEVGSLVGRAYNASMRQCYAIAKITAGSNPSNVGGVVGLLDGGGYLSECFGRVDSADQSGDTCLCGPCGVICLTDGQAMNVYRFAEKNWDFVATWTYDRAQSSWPMLRPMHSDIYEHDDIATEATPIATDGTIQYHVIRSGDVDWVMFTLTEEEDVLITTPGRGVELELFDADIRAVGDGVPKSAILENCAAGQYYVRVSPSEPKLLPYGLMVIAEDVDAFEPDDDSLQAGVIDTDGSGQWHRYVDGDQDWFTFTLDGSRWVWLQTTSPGGELGGVELFSTDNLNEGIACTVSMTRGNHRWERYDLPAGQYYIHVGSGSGSAGYYVALWDVPGPKYSGGFGTEDLPYELATPADLQELSAETDDYSEYFILTDDIDLAGHTFATAVIAADSDPNGFDYEGAPFDGHLDGNGHVIRNMTIDDGGLGLGYLGLLGKVGPGAYITGLSIKNASITCGEGAYIVGALAGQYEGMMENCQAEGTIVCADFASSVGGLVGESTGEILRCRSSVLVSCEDYAWQIGGLVGVGGIVSECYASGAVTTQWYAETIGGLAGRTDSINDSYSTGLVGVDILSMRVGGLVGELDGLATHCYATGLVWDVALPFWAGGLIGEAHRSDQPVQCFWDPDRTGMSVGVGAMGVDGDCLPLSATEASDPTVFTDATWDLSTIWQPTVGWPLLRAFNYAELNDDGIADMADFVLLVEAMTGPGQPTSFHRADLDGDGDCDLADVAMFARTLAAP